MVVTDTLGERLLGVVQLDETWRRRRVTEGAEQALEEVTDIDLGSPRVCEVTDLWYHLITAVGAERCDKVWDHPDFLPMAEDLDEPATFINSVLGGSDNDDFDPVAELEEQLHKEAEKRVAEGKDSDTDENNSGDTDDGK